MASVAEAADYLIESGDDSLILLGVDPAEAETDYGWIKPGFSATNTNTRRFVPSAGLSKSPRRSWLAHSWRTAGCGIPWSW